MSKVAEASPKQVSEWLAAGEAVLVDVREPDEFARERIKGAKLVPLSRLDAAEAARDAGLDQRIVMQCRGGRRSMDAARMAAGVVGDRQIVSLAGGIEAWKQAGLPVEVDTRVSGLSVMRQVQLTIGLGVLTACGLAWFVDPRFILLAAFFGAGLTVAGATGTCGLAAVIARMPWNRAASCKSA